MESSFDLWLYQNLARLHYSLDRNGEMELEAWALDYDKNHYAPTSTQHKFFVNIFCWPKNIDRFITYREERELHFSLKAVLAHSDFERLFENHVTLPKLPAEEL